jgi:hypothetical protein
MLAEAEKPVRMVHEVSVRAKQNRSVWARKSRSVWVRKGTNDSPPPLAGGGWGRGQSDSRTPLIAAVSRVASPQHRRQPDV